MSNLRKLPLYRIAHAVQSNEDWNLSLALVYSDGVTPIDLSGIAFVASFGGYTVDGALSGSPPNVLTLAAPAAVVATWTEGVYPLIVLATASEGAQDLLGFSMLMVGEPQAPPFMEPIGRDMNLIISTSPPPASPPGTQTPAEIAQSLAALSRAELLALADAIFLALPHAENGEAIPAPGLPYAQASGFYIDSQ